MIYPIIVSTYFVVIYHIESHIKGATKKRMERSIWGGMFNSYSNTEENIKNIKKGKIFTHNDIKITAYIGEVYRVLKERNTRIYI